MKTLKIIVALALGLTVTACGTVPDIASRNAPFEVTPPEPSVALAAQPGVAPAAQPGSALRVSQINVTVPRTLRVSEANSYYPLGDIVWRGELIGDRHAQVQTIFEDAFRAGTEGLNGPTDVTLNIEVVRFHSLSEKARYSVGGVHNMVFKLTVTRTSTGQALAPTREVVADLPAFGGKRAIEADRRGETQKVRIHAYLQQVIQQELSRFVAG
jgi:hypothetical protein